MNVTLVNAMNPECEEEMLALKAVKKKDMARPHVAASKILRKKIDARISRENRQIATRLEQSWSSGYGTRRNLRGPLAKKIEEARFNWKPRLQQPDMEF